MTSASSVVRFAKLQHWVVDSGFLPRLSQNELRLFLSLIKHAHNGDGKVWCSRSILLEDTGLHKTGFKAAKNGLARKGLICFEVSVDSGVRSRKGLQQVFWVAQEAPFKFAVTPRGHGFEFYGTAIRDQKVAGKRTKKGGRSAKVIGFGPQNRTHIRVLKQTPPRVLKQDPLISSNIASKISVIRENSGGDKTKGDKTIDVLLRSTCCDPLRGSTTSDHPSDESCPLDSLEPISYESCPQDLSSFEPSDLKADVKPSAGTSTEETPATAEAAKPGRKGTPLSDRSDAVGRVLARHCENFEKMTGQKFMPDFGKDGRLIKALIKVHPIERLLDFNDAFFRDTDPFIRNSGYSVSVFKVSVNRYAVRKPIRTGAAKSGEIAEGTRTAPLETATETIFKEFKAGKWIEVRIPKANTSQPLDLEE